MVECIGFIEPLNLECLLVNMFAGSVDIFVYAAIIMIAAIGAYFRMMNSTILIMLALFGLFMANQFQGISFLIVLITGLIVAVFIGRLVKN